LLIIDELSLNSGVESQYAIALAVKGKLETSDERVATHNRWILENLRRGPKLAWWLVARQFGRIVKGLLPYYTRLVPMRIKMMVPVRLRQTVKRLLEELERGAQSKATDQQ
jgi:hypothetical protein